MSVATTLLCCIVIDDAGRSVKLTKPAHRVISLAPHITETLYALGGGEHIVGVTTESDYPPQTNKNNIGSYYQVDIEKAIALHPDLIITWGNYFPHVSKTFSQLGIPVYVSDPHSLKDIPHTMKNLGCLLGLEKTANESANIFTNKIVNLEKTYKREKPIKMFYQIGAYSLFTINKNNWISEAIKICGGKNIFQDMKLPVSAVTWEAIVTADPQVVINDSMQENWKNRWQVFRNITAVKDNKLYSLNPDLLERPGPRVVEGIKELCEVIS